MVVIRPLMRRQAALATLVLLCGTLLLSAGLSNVFVSNSLGGEGQVGGTESWPRLAGRSQPHQARSVGRRTFASSSSTFSSNKRKAATPQKRVVHLDLKGAPPRISYLRRLLPVVREAGATSLLVEYEDMFPYSGRLANASAENHYTEEEVGELLDAAAEAGLEVIPLVQTFGHLEHVLKLEEFVHLREDQSYAESACPSRNGTLRLVTTMIDQVMYLHKSHRSFSGIVHIGCDEVFHLATCSECASRLRRLNSASSSKKRAASSVAAFAPGAAADSVRRRTGRHLFLEHVKAVARHVRSAHDGATALVWDDMLRAIPAAELRESRVGELVEPVVWVYGEQVDAFVGGHVWHKYSSVFGPRLWAASAYKGAFGERLLLPVARRHLRNNLAWAETMWREGRASGSGNGRHPAGFRGLVLTGWSRYDHFAVLCELLPVAIPSLVLDLVSVSHPNSEREREAAWRRSMNCGGESGAKQAYTSFKDLYSSLQRDDSDDRLYEAASECKFPGRPVFDAVLGLARLRQTISREQSDSGGARSGVAAVVRPGGWLTSYNVRHNFTSSWRVAEPAAAAKKALRALEDVSSEARGAMREVYDGHTVYEWLEQNVDPLRTSLADSLATMESLMSRKTWPRRPLTATEEEGGEDL